MAYAIYVSLAKTYFIEIWLPPVAIISLITLAFAFIKIHGLPFHQFLMNLIEYNVLAKKRIWIQGTGIPFFSPLNEVKEKKEGPKIEAKTTRTAKSLEELSKIVDTHGQIEINPVDKKEELTKLINQNYK